MVVRSEDYLLTSDENPADEVTSGCFRIPTVVIVAPANLSKKNFPRIDLEG